MSAATGGTATDQVRCDALGTPEAAGLHGDFERALYAAL
jgi:hypothetical protein